MASIAQMSPEELKMLCPSGYSTRGKANIAVIAILLPLSLFAVSLRLYVRKNITRALWWDDLALVTALVSPRRDQHCFLLAEADTISNSFSTYLPAPWVLRKPVLVLASI